MKRFVARSTARAAIILLCLSFTATAALAETEAKVPVQTFELDNGMKFLLVPQPERTTVAGGWVAHVGSANERPGITGLSHLFEHMMFKGTAHHRDHRSRDKDRSSSAKSRSAIRGAASRDMQQGRQLRPLEERGEIDDPWDPKNRHRRADGRPEGRSSTSSSRTSKTRHR